jgi:Ca-activated chloride channel family protein
LTFQYPYLFLLFPLIAFLIFRAKRKGKSLAFPLTSRNFRKPQGLLWPILVPLILKALAFLLVIAALARPQTSSSQVRRTADGIDIVVALDVSQSMSIEDVDVEDQNRLDVAKETVKKFIAGRKEDRIGFVMFSGEGVTLCPPTLDYEILLETVERAEMGILKDGTAIGEALATSVNRLKDSTAKSRVVILVTDGDNNMGAIAPLTAGEIARGYGIKVYTIALGKEGAVRYPVYTNFFGIQRKSYQYTQSTINPSLLMKIAEETGGKFFRAGDADSLEKVFGDINKLEKNSIETKDRVLWQEQYQIFLAVAVVVFLLEFLLSKTFFRILPE